MYSETSLSNLSTYDGHLNGGISFGHIGSVVNGQKLDIRFKMHTADGVRAFLTHINILMESAYKHFNFEVMDMVADFKKAVANAGLGEREKYVIHAVFIEDMSQSDVADETGITRQTVNTQIRRATEKIAQQYVNDEADFAEFEVETEYTF